jgi:hypothetical protein
VLHCSLHQTSFGGTRCNQISGSVLLTTAAQTSMQQSVAAQRTKRSCRHRKPNAHCIRRPIRARDRRNSPASFTHAHAVAAARERLMKRARYALSLKNEPRRRIRRLDGMDWPMDPLDWCGRRPMVRGTIGRKLFSVEQIYEVPAKRVPRRYGTIRCTCFYAGIGMELTPQAVCVTDPCVRCI